MDALRDVFVCDGVRTPIGRYGGALAQVRTDDLAAIPIKALVKRHPKVDWSALDEVVLGCANQAGEDNRNVARMALLLAGIPDSVPGVTVNRLCASGLNAIGDAARAIRCGETDFAIAGGVESMTRAPLVMAKAQEAFQTQCGDRRHDLGLALHQSAVESAVRRSTRWRRPGRTWRRTIRSPARTRMRSPCARSSAPARRWPAAISPRRACRWRYRAGKRGPITLDKDEHPRPQTTPRRTCQAQAVCAQSRHGDRR